MKNKFRGYILTFLMAMILICTCGSMAVRADAAETDDLGYDDVALYAVADGVYAESGKLICYQDGSVLGAGWHKLSSPVENLGSGSKTLSGDIYYYVSSAGSVTYKITMSGDTPAYVYKWSGSAWTLQKSTLFRMYDGKSHYLNASGKNVSTAGWYKYSSNTHIYVCSAGYVTGMLKSDGTVWRYYIYDYNAQKWNQQKCKWVTAYGNSFYMSGTGYSTRKYYSSNGTCYNYSGGKWTKVKNSYCTLQDGKAYYFNSDGTCVTSKGWKNIGNNTLIYVCSAGYVTGMMQKSGSVWRYYIYNYTTKGWVQQKSKWVTVNTNSYYINASGYSGRAYYSTTRKCYNYINGTWVLFKNNYCTLQDGNAYYFDATGVRVSKAGTYTTSSGVKVTTDSTGKVTKTTQKVYQYVSIDLGDGTYKTVYGYYDDEMTDELIDMLNEYRVSNGLSKLTVSTGLMQAAKTRSAEISYYFSHDRPNGTDCFVLSDEMSGENIAAGYGSAESVMSGWKNSTGHNANMLGAYTKIGISVFVAVDGDNEGYSRYFVQNFGY